MMLEIKDNKTNNHLSRQHIQNKKNTMTYDVRNQGQQNKQYPLTSTHSK